MQQQKLITRIFVKTEKKKTKNFSKNINVCMK